ncbi:MAG: DTW domain-containing protein [Gammaproteobacteria bacterium]|nr:MAG: DTW domain-containing protein [Gammaproteobacteria bacterium]
MNKRPTCKLCLRPEKTCICKFIRPVENLVSLFILQHPQEVLEVKNTGRLLHLCLKNSQLCIGEDFGNIFFQEITSPDYYDILLYPDVAEEKSLGMCSPNPVDANHINNGDALDKSGKIRLWVLDATWRKSRKMLYLNPALQSMPRLNLQDCPSSIYKIRKAHSQNQLSTLEASCYALQKIEHGAVNYSPILEAFAAFVDQQQAFLPTSP